MKCEKIVEICVKLWLFDIIIDKLTFTHAYLSGVLDQFLNIKKVILKSIVRILDFLQIKQMC